VPRWGIAPGQLLRHRGWDEVVVVYNDLSGDTHLLSAAAWTLLSALQDGPDAQSDSAALAERLELDPDDLPQLDAMLASLSQLGLVELAAPHPSS
jgi:PqqD family protein of HPr-rel-A system